MLRKLVLAVSFSTLAAFSGSVLAAAFDVTDIEGRKVHFEDQPKTFVVANYIANFMMVGGAPGLEKVVALTKDGWEDTRYGEYQVFTKSFRSAEYRRVSRRHSQCREDSQPPSGCPSDRTDSIRGKQPEN